MTDRTITGKTVPPYAGRIVSLVQYKGRVIVACERAVFMVSSEDELVPMLFRVPEDMVRPRQTFDPTRGRIGNE